MAEVSSVRVASFVFDTTDARRLAEFYRRLLGATYRPGDEPPDAFLPDERGSDWLVLLGPSGSYRLAFQQVRELKPVTWPEGAVPQQMHLDLCVSTKAALDEAHERALALGAKQLFDRSRDPEEPLRVYSDPSGHPFCIFLADEG